jgi:cell division protein ZapB
MSAQSPIDQIAQRVERLLARHDEILRANALLHEQVASLAQERDALLARFAAARMRLDAVLERLPAELSQDVFDNNSPPAASTTSSHAR